MMPAPIAFILGFLAGACVMWLWRQRDNSPPKRQAEAGPTPRTGNQSPTTQNSGARVHLADPAPARAVQRGIPAAPVVDPEGARSRPGASAPVLAPTPVSRPAAIVTRTTPSQGASLHDSFAIEGERQWTPAEQRDLMSQYEDQQTVREIAIAMQLDQKQVAARLIRLLLDPKGRIDNDDEMTNARSRYSEQEEHRMREAYEAGLPLPALAQELGRSQLGVGWRMLDRHIPLVRTDHTFLPN